MQRIPTMVVMLLAWPTLGDTPVLAPSPQMTDSARAGGEKHVTPLPGGGGDSHAIHFQMREKHQMLEPLALPDEPEETRKLPDAADSQQHDQLASPEANSPVGDCIQSPLIPEARPPRKARFVWYTERTAAPNYRKLGRLLSETHGDLYRHHADGHALVQVLPDGTVRRINTGAKLAPVLVDRVKMIVVRNDRVVGELPSSTHLNAMLRSEEFLTQFRPLDEIVMEPFYLNDFSLVVVGYNDRGEGQRILYVGAAPDIADSTATIEKFLDAMVFATPADRANTVAAALTLKLRHHWPGQKPLIVITASKSHSGKGTVTEFIRGSAPKADVMFQDRDWPMVRMFQSQLQLNPQLGLVLLDNVRCDSAGHAHEIRSAFIESFVTTEEICLAAPGAGDPIRVQNRFLVVINTNDGNLSTDMMNRALSIHLEPRGSVLDHACPLGNPKLDFLPKHRAQIDAELHGMICKWRAAGCPLDNDVKHSMLPWARAIGGILKVCGYTGFLANATSRRSVDDPVHRALATLGATYPDRKLRPRDWAKRIVMLGLDKTLLPANERGSLKGRERSTGVVLKRHLHETFTGFTETKRLHLRLEGGLRRWKKGKSAHVRYFFEVLETTDRPTDDLVPAMDLSLNLDTSGHTASQAGADDVVRNDGD